MQKFEKQNITNGKYFEAQLAKNEEKEYSGK